jgi:transcription elongation factor GreA
LKTDDNSTQLSEAVARYISSLGVDKANTASTFLSPLISWFGPKRKVSDLGPAEISKYSQQCSPSDPEITDRLGETRSFLVYLKREGLSGINLAASVKVKKIRQAAGSKPAPKPVVLTADGYKSLQNELESLKKKRPKVIDAVRLAAADKDFRENSPLSAAKEELGHIEGRINEIQEILKLAIPPDEKAANSRRVSVGDEVMLKERQSGEIFKYIIVSTREANPLKGKISDCSPIGKTLVGRQKGDTVEVEAPLGKLTYLIEEIKKPFSLYRGL